MSDDIEQLLADYKSVIQHYASIPGEVGARARVALDGPLVIMDSPYLITYEQRCHYNPNFGDDRICVCGHSYIRHFDTYEDYYPAGCKYCTCGGFRCESEYKPWKLFLDDERDPIGKKWIVCRTSYGVYEECGERGLPSFISFDHDLGENSLTGYDVAKWIIDQILDGRWKLPKDFGWYVHSQNPIGAENINMLLTNFMKVHG